MMVLVDTEQAVEKDCDADGFEVVRELEAHFAHVRRRLQYNVGSVRRAHNEKQQIYPTCNERRGVRVTFTQSLKRSALLHE